MDLLERDYGVAPLQRPCVLLCQGALPWQLP